MKTAFNFFNPQKCQKRWVCYFDILGFKERLKCHGIVETVHWYFQCREIVADQIRKQPRLLLQCFSDTFLIYSSDDNTASFFQIEQAARWIVNLNLAKRIPLRGAIACGEVYIAEEDDIYIGSPLNEAFGHGENLNWIGLRSSASPL
jgi:predicted proteasome-type protease